MEDRYVFPAIFEPGDIDGYTVSFPDLPGCITEGDTLDDAFAMAKEALELYLFTLEEAHEPIPRPSPLHPTAVGADEMVAVIEAWMPLIRSRIANQSVKKNLTVPKWLAEAADREHLNYSQVLQEALKTRLGVTAERSGPTS